MCPRLLLTLLKSMLDAADVVCDYTDFRALSVIPICRCDCSQHGVVQKSRNTEAQPFHPVTRALSRGCGGVLGCPPRGILPLTLSSSVPSVCANCHLILRLLRPSSGNPQLDSCFSTYTLPCACFGTYGLLHACFVAHEIVH